jgi:hypothetical protein
MFAEDFFEFGVAQVTWVFSAVLLNETIQSASVVCALLFQQRLAELSEEAVDALVDVFA